MNSSRSSASSFVSSTAVTVPVRGTSRGARSRRTPRRAKRRRPSRRRSLSRSGRPLRCRSGHRGHPGGRRSRRGHRDGMSFMARCSIVGGRQRREDRVRAQKLDALDRNVRSPSIAEAAATRAPRGPAASRPTTISDARVLIRSSSTGAISAPRASPRTRMLWSAPKTRPSTSSGTARCSRVLRYVDERVSDPEDPHQEHRADHGRPHSDQREPRADQQQPHPEIRTRAASARRAQTRLPPRPGLRPRAPR